MMKSRKLVSLLLALCLCIGLLPLTALAAGTAIPVETPEYGELQDFLGQFNFGWKGQIFDPRDAATLGTNEYGWRGNILETLIGDAVSYMGPAPITNPWDTNWAGADPLGKWDAHNKTNGAWVEWVLANVFNCSQADISALRSSLSSNGKGSYYLDGYYYSQAFGIGGSMNMFVITDITPYENYYFINYEIRLDPTLTDSDMLINRCFAVVQRKTIEESGTGYWSLYYNRVLKDGETLNLPTSSVDAPPSSVDDFIDVKSGDYFYNAARWGVEQGIIYGTATNAFSPNQTCTKAQILTFLWRAYGSPEPSISNPYNDIYGGSYYYKAALWAREKNLVWAGTFNPDQPCTRGMTMDYLWQLAGSPVVEGNTFSDVPFTSEYVRAVLWAVSAGITAGTGGTTFSPDAICTRAQIITFIYRAAGYETITPPDLSPNITDTYSAWNQAYKDFVVNEKFLTAKYDYHDSNDPSHPWGNEIDKYVALYDMDADGIPELFIHSGYEDRFGEMYYVFTFANGQIIYIGRMKELYYKPGSQFTGIWSYWTESGTDPDYFNYGWKDGNQIHVEGVYSQEFGSTYKKRETDNIALYNEFVSTDYFNLPVLPRVKIKEIQSTGWDAFVAKTLG